MFQNLLPKELIAQKLEETNQSSATLDKKSQTELEKKRKKLINSSDSNENTSPIKKPKVLKNEIH